MPRTAQQRAGSHGRVRLPRVLLLVAMLAGCAVVAAPARSADVAGARPGAALPAAPARLPDAEPGWEPIRSDGPNMPHEVLVRRHAPVARDAPFTQRGLASWYGRRFHGKRTASGEVYDMHALTAAHRTLPMPSYARVRNPANGREVVVRINDRGPFHSKRIIDLSYAAAQKLDLLHGVALVELQRVPSRDTRSDAWQRGAVGGAVRAGVEANARAADAAVTAPAGSGAAAIVIDAALDDAGLTPGHGVARGATSPPL